MAVIAHPHPLHGGTLTNKVVQTLARAFVLCGWTAVRFNFRGVGLSAGAWDEGRGEMDDYRAVLDYTAAAYPGVELWAAGFSFGSYIAMTCGAGDDRVCTLIGIAPQAWSWSRPVRSFRIWSTELRSVQQACA